MKQIHHIIPKHMGGTNDPSNLIELTLEEHAEAHKILYELYGKKEDLAAYLGLSGLVNKKEIYQLLLDEKRGKPLSNEVKEKISKSLKGRKHTWGHKISATSKKQNKTWLIGNKNASGNKDKPKSEEHKNKISQSHKKIKKDWLKGNKHATSLKGRKKEQSHQEAINKALNSVEVKEKITASWNKRPIVKCPHCGVEGKNNMNRYHFDNCKKVI